MRSLAKLILASAVTFPAARMVAQEKPPKPPEHFYHLIFQVEELDSAGKVTNSRTYATTSATEDHQNAVIKTGTKIPVRNSDKGDVNYLDVGVDIEARETVEEGAKLGMTVSAILSSLAVSGETISSSPIIRQNTWNAHVLIPVGKPTMIFVSDNLENKGKTQVELTATRVE